MEYKKMFSIYSRVSIFIGFIYSIFDKRGIDNDTLDSPYILAHPVYT